MAQLKVTLLRSSNSARKNHKATVQALGLRKIGQTVINQDKEALRGMIQHVRHLVVSEPCEGEDDEAH